jgi:hypothetical protein
MRATPSFFIANVVVARLGQGPPEARPGIGRGPHREAPRAHEERAALDRGEATLGDVHQVLGIVHAQEERGSEAPPASNERAHGS